MPASEYERLQKRAEAAEAEVKYVQANKDGWQAKSEEHFKRAKAAEAERDSLAKRISHLREALERVSELRHPYGQECHCAGCRSARALTEDDAAGGKAECIHYIPDPETRCMICHPEIARLQTHSPD